ncbi:MAG: electron transfer flavoprotein subunit beta/FixA family protein, partial [Oligoflexia bacterium]|nr:electron transfer flavoprotein subunit beta/FixA family protein [Oligoflexia bacterium]
MNILVCIKQVPDTGIRIQLLKDGKGIDESGIEWIINPYDEFALEEALRIKERIPNTTIQVLSLGPSRVEKALRTALAMGADKAILIETPVKPSPSSSSEENSSLNPGFVAQALAQIISSQKDSSSPEALKKTSPEEEKKLSLEKINWDLLLTGKVGIDENHSATGPMLAEKLNAPHVGFVTKLQEKTKDIWLCERQMEEGITEEITLHLPALITVEKGLNEPRYPSLPGIMKAKKKELKKINLSKLDISYDKQM